jgi:hypothetical protein
MMLQRKALGAATATLLAVVVLLAGSLANVHKAWNVALPTLALVTYIF